MPYRYERCDSKIEKQTIGLSEVLKSLLRCHFLKLSLAYNFNKTDNLHSFGKVPKINLAKIIVLILFRMLLCK